MANHNSKTADDKGKGGLGVAATLGVVAASVAVAGGAVYAASRKAKTLSRDLDLPESDVGDVDADEFAPVASTGAPSGMAVGADALMEDAPSVVPQPMRYTGGGTPDMAISYTPGLDQDDSRVASAPAGDEIGEIGTAEQRDALAGVQS